MININEIETEMSFQTVRDDSGNTSATYQEMERFADLHISTEKQANAALKVIENIDKYKNCKDPITEYIIGLSEEERKHLKDILGRRLQNHAYDKKYVSKNHFRPEVIGSLSSTKFISDIGNSLFFFSFLFR